MFEWNRQRLVHGDSSRRQLGISFLLEHIPLPEPGLTLGIRAFPNSLFEIVLLEPSLETPQFFHNFLRARETVARDQPSYRKPPSRKLVFLSSQMSAKPCKDLTPRVHFTSESLRASRAPGLSFLCVPLEQAPGGAVPTAKFRGAVMRKLQQLASSDRYVGSDKRA